MSAILFTGMYLDGMDASGGSRVLRNSKYVTYYEALKEELGFESIFMADNASDPLLVEWFMRNHEVNVIRYREHLAPIPTMSYGYPYCWRTLWTARDLFLGNKKITKIILIDSDLFVLSGRLAAQIKNYVDGWGTLWCPKYGFPEAAFQVIAGSGIDHFLKYTDRPWSGLLGRKMETELPFTHVEKGFIGDRYGEEPKTAPARPDFYAQAPVDKEFSFNKGQ